MSRVIPNTTRSYDDSHASIVKALQGLGMLDASMVLWVQESVIQWFKDSDEGVSPN